MFQRDYYNFFSIKSLQKMNSQTLNFFVNLCEKNENPVCECVVNHSGFCSYPDTDPTRGSDPDLDPIPDPSRSRSGPEGTRIRNILTSPKIQVFFLSLSPSKLQISCFSRQHLACICHWSHLRLLVKSPQTATPAWRPTPTGNIEISFLSQKKNYFCSDPDTDTTRGMVWI